MRNEEKLFNRTTYHTKEEYMKRMNTESVIYYDAVQLLSQSLDDMNSLGDIVPESFTCSSRGVWSQGYSIASYMKRV